MDLCVLVYDLTVFNSSQEQIINTVLFVENVNKTFFNRLNDDDLAVVKSLFIKFMEEIINKSTKESAFAEL